MGDELRVGSRLKIDTTAPYVLEPDATQQQSRTNLDVYVESIQRLGTQPVFPFSPLLIKNLKPTENGSIVLSLSFGADPHLRLMEGRISPLEGSIGRKAHHAAVRDPAHPVFGFAVARHLNHQAALYEEKVTHPVVHSHIGDLADKGSISELDLFRAASSVMPSIATPGNHDVLHQGHRVSDKDAFGAITAAVHGLQTFLQPDSYAEEWNRYTGGNHANKYAYSRWSLEHIYGFTPDEIDEIEIRLLRSDETTFTTEDGTIHFWENKEDVYHTFWKRHSKGNLAFVRYVGPEYNPNHDVIIISTLEKEISLPENKKETFYLLSTDSMDYSERSEQPHFPGMDLGFSNAQYQLWNALNHNVLSESPKSPVGIMTHLTLGNMSHPTAMARSIKPWERYQELIHSTKAQVHFSGHTHKAAVEKVALNNGSIVDITAPSSADYQNGSLMVNVIYDESNQTYRFVHQNVGVDIDNLNVSDAVLKELKAYNFLAYQQAYQFLPDAIKEDLDKLEANNYIQWIAIALRNAITQGLYNNVEVLRDLILVQEIQFQQTIKLFKSVAKLLGSGGQFEKLSELISKMETAYQTWQKQKINFEDDYEVVMTLRDIQLSDLTHPKFRKVHVTQAQNLLELFNASDENGAFVTQAQFLLTKIPVGSEADTFMILAAITASHKEAHDTFYALKPKSAPLIQQAKAFAVETVDQIREAATQMAASARLMVQRAQNRITIPPMLRGAATAAFLTTLRPPVSTGSVSDDNAIALVERPVNDSSNQSPKDQPQAVAKLLYRRKTTGRLAAARAHSFRRARTAAFLR